jgi:hypothetical protein
MASLMGEDTVRSKLGLPATVFNVWRSMLILPLSPSIWSNPSRSSLSSVLVKHASFSNKGVVHTSCSSLFSGHQRDRLPGPCGIYHKDCLPYIWCALAGTCHTHARFDSGGGSAEAHLQKQDSGEMRRYASKRREVEKGHSWMWLKKMP